MFIESGSMLLVALDRYPIFEDQKFNNLKLKKFASFVIKIAEFPKKGSYEPSSRKLPALQR